MPQRPPKRPREPEPDGRKAYLMWAERMRKVWTTPPEWLDVPYYVTALPESERKDEP